MGCCLLWGLCDQKAAVSPGSAHFKNVKTPLCQDAEPMQVEEFIFTSPTTFIKRSKFDPPEGATMCRIC